jgi:cell shape-determining protein MreD
MIRYLFLTITLILVTLFQGTFLPLMISVPPNLLLVITLALLFTGQKNEAYFSALVGGLLNDLTTLSPIGLSSLYLLLTTGAVRLIEQKIGSAKYKVLGFTFAASVVLRVLGVGMAIERLSPQLLYSSALDAVLILVVVPMVRLLLQTLGGKRELKVKR